MVDLRWQAAPDGWRLGETAVHLWRVPLAQPPEVVARLHALLAPDEQARAARFHFERHRRQFAVARGALRTLLGGYLGVAETAVAFTYTTHGKPELPGADLCFNVSHSGELALMAFARRRMLGVDVEAVRELQDAAGIAERFFAPSEVAVFRQVAPAWQPQAFFNCWTRKEAFIKAIGEGLSHPLDRFEVTLRPGEPARLLTVDGSAAEAARWRLAAVDPAPGYIGALIARDWEGELACYAFRP
ncbi:MAG: 4'-phosphopantetheinyl transferase superfamily protein [Anaerolineales bacterium]|nr:4'-phosphopantetheinyl transferase superfamily protein [Anaerolineales bacterium]